MAATVNCTVSLLISNMISYTCGTKTTIQLSFLLLFSLNCEAFFFFFFLCHILIHLATLQAICDHSEGHIWPKTFDTPVIVCVTVDLHNGKRLMMILSLIAC